MKSLPWQGSGDRREKRQSGGLGNRQQKEYEAVIER